jgi:flagellar biosynthetic protein FliQ
METGQIFDIARMAVFVLLKVSLPILLVSMVVGLIISLFQALTQIQEVTLTFVPKIITVMLSLLIFGPFMYRTLYEFFIVLTSAMKGSFN